MTAGAGLTHARRTAGGRSLSAHRVHEEAPREAREAESADLEALYRRYHTALHAYLTRMTGDAEEAKDLTQEVFLRAHRRLPQGATAAHPRAWLFQIATYTCFDHFRRQRSRVVTESAPDDLQDRCATDPFEQSQEAEAVSESLRRLPPRQRAAIILKDIYGLKHAEIATTMGISEGAAQVLLYRARGKFKDEYLRLTPVSTGCPVAHRLVTDLADVDLTLEQRRELRDHAKICPECRRRLGDRRTPAGVLGFLVAPVTRPSGLTRGLSDVLRSDFHSVVTGSNSVPCLGPIARSAGPVADGWMRFAAPLSDWSATVSSKAAALLLAVALAGIGHIGASMPPGSNGSDDAARGDGGRGGPMVAAATPQPSRSEDAPTAGHAERDRTRSCSDDTGAAPSHGGWETQMWQEGPAEQGDGARSGPYTGSDSYLPALAGEGRTSSEGPVDADGRSAGRTGGGTPTPGPSSAGAAIPGAPTVVDDSAPSGGESSGPETGDGPGGRLG